MNAFVLMVALLGSNPPAMPMEDEIVQSSDDLFDYYDSWKGIQKGSGDDGEGIFVESARVAVGRGPVTGVAIRLKVAVQSGGPRKLRIVRRPVGIDPWLPVPPPWTYDLEQPAPNILTGVVWWEKGYSWPWWQMWAELVDEQGRVTWQTEVFSAP